MRTGKMLNIIVALVVLVLAGIAISSCGRHDTELDTGCYYRAKGPGQECFVWLDSLDQKGATGHYYDVAGDDSIAVRHDFSAVFSSLGRVTMNIAGVDTLRIKRKKWSFSLYEEPPFVEGNWKLYRYPCYKVTVRPDLVYGHAKGYWTSLQGMEDEMSSLFTKGYLKSFRKRDLDLALDLYTPVGAPGKKPLILLIHGGAFYFGSKDEPAYVEMCSHYASMGYVTASINYRLGFRVNKNDIERAGYVALQDAHAALRYLVANASTYDIDADRIYVAGSSAGAITALNLAFMTDDSRPSSSKDIKVLFVERENLGPIASSGNDIKADFKIRAIANMWGAVNDLSLLKNGKTAIVSFHGDNDNVVPYGEGYPLSGAGDNIAKLLSNVMYGSACIDKKAAELGLRHRFYPFPGRGHAFNTDKNKKPNADHFLIRDRIADFFFQDIVPQQAAITDDGHGRYSVHGKGLSDIQWKAQGGFILESSRDSLSVRVLWRSDVPGTLVSAGKYSNGIDWMSSLQTNPLQNHE